MIQLWISIGIGIGLLSAWLGYKFHRFTFTEVYELRAADNHPGAIIYLYIPDKITRENVSRVLLSAGYTWK